MSLYASLAPRYDALFPPSPLAARFLDSLVPRPLGPRSVEEGRRALDAGCATGSHALGLAELGWRVVGLDSEEAMIALAREKAAAAGLASRASFILADALDQGGGAAPARGPFDLVLCLGNTLPHFRGESAAAFLRSARGRLAPGGRLVLQSVNYAYPGLGPGHRFPPLAAGGVTMRRRYDAPSDGEPEALRFIVELEEEGKVEVDETILQPRPPALIASLLRESGFSEPRLLSGWEGAPFDPLVDFYLLAVALAGDGKDGAAARPAP
jgi:SAM-dependent methyltransferase